MRMRSVPRMVMSMHPKIIYVSGKYRARTIFGKLWNIWKARRVAERLWREGWICICPHCNTLLFDEDTPYIIGDCEIISRCCDAVYMLRGWEESEGSRIEYSVAQRLGLEILLEEDEDIKTFDTAEELIKDLRKTE